MPSVKHEKNKWDLRESGRLYIHPHLLEARGHMKAHMALYNKNLRYLLKERGMKIKDLRNWFDSVKDHSDSNPVPGTEIGFPPNIYNLIAVSNFFGRSFTQMLSLDIEQFDKEIK